MRILNKAYNLFSLDAAIIWSIINKIIGLLKGTLLLWFIIKYLSKEDQGLWYTFISLGALTIFAELGFTTIITQFVSHEFAYLNFEKDIGITSTDEFKVDRFFAIVKFSLKLYLYIVPFSILLLLIVGYVYFNYQIDKIYFAWILYAISGGLNLMVSLFQSIFMGFDKVKEIQVNQLILNLSNLIFTCILLTINLNIFALSIASLLSCIVSSYLLFKLSPTFWLQVLNFNNNYKHNIFNEIIPLQWRYALSWISGYFIFYLVVPVTYKYIGSIEAGQFGLTNSLVAVISGLSSNWVFTKIPKFNILIAHTNRKELDKLFFKSCKLAVLIQVIGSFLLVFILYILQCFNIYNGRFLPINLTILLLFSQLVQSLINYIAVYLRAHKEEPFVILSIVNAIFICLLTFFILRNYTLLEYLIGINIILLLIIFPWGLTIFVKKRNKIDIIYE